MPTAVSEDPGSMAAARAGNMLRKRGHELNRAFYRNQGWGSLRITMDDEQCLSVHQVYLNPKFSVILNTNSN